MLCSSSLLFQNYIGQSSDAFGWSNADDEMKTCSGDEDDGAESQRRLRLPAALPPHRRVVSVSAGSFHSLFTTAAGFCYSFGSGDNGRLGHGDRVDRKVPTLITAFATPTCTTVPSASLPSSTPTVFVVGASAGGKHSAVWDSAGRLFMFGAGSVVGTGRPSSGSEADDVLSPALLPLDERCWTTLYSSAARSTSAASVRVRPQTRASRFYLDNDDADVDSSDSKYGDLLGGDDVDTDRRRQSSQRAGSAKRSRVTASGACRCRDVDDVVQGRATGNDGDGTAAVPVCPHHGSATTVVSASCGWHHTLVLTAAGHVFALGVGVNGQLGHGDDVSHLDRPSRLVKFHSGGEVSTPPPRVVAVSAGDAHSAVVTECGELYTFGLGDSGQLGQHAVAPLCEHSRDTAVPAGSPNSASRATPSGSPATTMTSTTIPRLVTFRHPFETDRSGGGGGGTAGCRGVGWCGGWSATCCRAVCRRWCPLALVRRRRATRNTSAPYSAGATGSCARLRARRTRR